MVVRLHIKRGKYTTQVKSNKRVTVKRTSQSIEIEKGQHHVMQLW